MSSPAIGDRVAVVRWASDLGSAPEYEAAVGILDAIEERMGALAYYVSIGATPEKPAHLTEGQWELVKVWLGNCGHYVIAREVVSLEPIEVAE